MSKKEKDLGEVWAATRNALSKFNNYEDQGGKDAKASKAQKELIKTASELAAELDKKREALMDAIGAK
jgi:hypothetical protein